MVGRPPIIEGLLLFSHCICYTDAVSLTVAKSDGLLPNLTQKS
jgi:hypothetical protein